MCAENDTRWLAAQRHPSPIAEDTERWSVLRYDNPVQQLGIKAERFSLPALLDHMQWEAEAMEHCNGSGECSDETSLREVDEHLSLVTIMRYAIRADHAMRAAAAVIKQVGEAIGETSEEMRVTQELLRAAMKPTYERSRVWEDYEGLRTAMRKK